VNTAAQISGRFAEEDVLSAALALDTFVTTPFSVGKFTIVSEVDEIATSDTLRYSAVPIAVVP
jgi:hypothetical protein